MGQVAHISGAIKGVIKPTISNLDKIVLDFSPRGQLFRVHEFGGAHFHGPGFFAWVCVDRDDTRSFDEIGSLDHPKPDRPTSKHGNSGPRYEIISNP